jgi:uncharacterized DUF497 family protein
MIIVFDPGTDGVNQAKHGVSLAQASAMDWDTRLEWNDDRHDYREDRRCALGLIGERLYCVVYVERTEGRRIISLRKANKREVTRYVEEQESGKAG